jgi:hypothetical protein
MQFKFRIKMEEKMQLPDISIRHRHRAALLLVATALCVALSGCFASKDSSNYALFATPMGLTFSAAAGASTTAQVTFYGTATMTGVALSGPNADLFSVPEGACVDVTTGASSDGCVVTVTFSPKAKGSYAATLTGNSNNGSAEVTLTASASSESPADAP